MRTFDAQALLDCARAFHEDKALDFGSVTPPQDVRTIGALIRPLILYRLRTGRDETAHLERVKDLLDAVGHWMDCQEEGIGAIVAEDRAVQAAWKVMGRTP